MTTNNKQQTSPFVQRVTSLALESLKEINNGAKVLKIGNIVIMKNEIVLGAINKSKKKGEKLLVGFYMFKTLAECIGLNAVGLSIENNSESIDELNHKIEVVEYE